MCGLAGFLRHDGAAADAAIVVRMLDRQAHRGPDDRGIWSHGPVALGLDRLSILDLSVSGHQPFVMPDGTSALSYNGEVYNWRALRMELEREGVQFQSNTDTEVVLHALSRWGPEAAVPRFNGMFALAWFDLTTKTLWLARDRIGIKPLYWTATADTLAFASEAKALFAHPAIACRPDMHALVTNLYQDRLSGDWTAFEGVRHLEPGTLMRCVGAERTTHTWFDIERDIDVSRIIAGADESFEDHVAQFRSLFERSVALHLQSDAPLAVMCSGGVDSSLTTAIAKRHRVDLVTYVAEAEGLRDSEADKAQIVADHIGVELRRIPVLDSDYPRLWALAAWHSDDPLYFAQNPLALRVSEAVHADGFKVLLTGEGADELFSGYEWIEETGRMWRRRAWHGRLIPDRQPFRLLGRLLGHLVPFPTEKLAGEPFERRATWLQSPPGAELAVDGGLRRRRARDLFAKLEPIRNVGDRAATVRALEDMYTHLRESLVANDNRSMAASIEARVPFLESDLIDFALHLPYRSKIHRGVRKRVVRSTAQDLLPRGIIDAPKVGFAVPGRMRAGYTGLLQGGIMAGLFKWGHREADRLRDVMAEHSHIGERLVSMELWAQMHFNGQSPAQMTERLRSIRSVG